MSSSVLRRAGELWHGRVDPISTEDRAQKANMCIPEAVVIAPSAATPWTCVGQGHETEQGIKQTGLSVEVKDAAEVSTVRTLPHSDCSSMLDYFLAVVVTVTAGEMRFRNHRGQAAPVVDDPARAEVDALRAELRKCNTEADGARKRAQEKEGILRAVEAKYTKLQKDLQQDLDEKQKQLTEKTAAHQKVVGLAKQFQAKTKELEGQLKCERSEKEAALERAEETSDKLEDVEKQLSRWKEKAGETTRELRRLTTQHEQMSSLLDTRTAELRDAQAYLSKTDAVADADVERMVVTLNEQIFQLSAQISDEVTSWGFVGEDCALQAAWDRMSSLVGSPVANRLLSTPEPDKNIWVQLGLQAILAVHASWLIVAWDISLAPHENRLLTQLHAKPFENGEPDFAYRRMVNTDRKTTEPQAISARWRALTRRYVGELFEARDLVALVTGHVLKDLQHALLLAGAEQLFRVRDWMDSFTSKVTDIVAQGLAIQKAVGEDMSSSDLQLLCPPCGEPFSARTMEDVEDCGRRRKRNAVDGKRVLCVNALGLQRCEKVAGEEGAAGEVKAVVLLKAKVALQNADM